MPLIYRSSARRSGSSLRNRNSDTKNGSNANTGVAMSAGRPAASSVCPSTEAKVVSSSAGKQTFSSSDGSTSAALSFTR